MHEDCLPSAGPHLRQVFAHCPPGEKEWEHLEGCREEGHREKQCCVLSLTLPPLMVLQIHLEVSLAKGRGQGSEEPQSLKAKTEQGPNVTQVLPQVWYGAYFRRNSKSLLFLMASEYVFPAPHTGELTVCLLSSTVCTGPGPQGQCHRQTVSFRTILCSFSSFLPTPSLW